jgi:hypothetical protein
VLVRRPDQFIDRISSAILSLRPKTIEAGEENNNCFKKSLLPSMLATVAWSGKSIKCHS